MPLIGGSQAIPFDARLVGERFERERELLGYTRAVLAAKCDYSAEQIRRVEKGEQAPGARLLAALAELGGDLKLVLTGAERQEISEDEAIYYAQYREEVHREAREWSRLKNDRRKKRLDDDEADLIEWFRKLSHVDRRSLLELVYQASEGKLRIPQLDSLAAPSVTATKGSIAAGGDVNLGKNSGRKR